MLTFIYSFLMQVILLLLAVIAVPWMLFPKPFILKKLHTEVSIAFYLSCLSFFDRCNNTVPLCWKNINLSFFTFLDSISFLS